MRALGKLSWGLTVMLVASSAQAEELAWRRSAPAPSARMPLVKIGRPRPVEEPDVSRGAVTSEAPLVKESFAPVGRIVRGQDAGPPPPPPPDSPFLPAPGTEEPYNCGVVTGSSGKGFFARCFDKCGEWFRGAPSAVQGIFQPAAGGKFLESDHCFDSFASPVTNPFYFEDPRALTEARPIFIWQHTPDNNWVFGGGDNFFAGVQVRVAFSEWLSLVVHKLGWVWIEPENGFGQFDNHAGFAELHLGPKFTFYRNDQVGSLAAFGLSFDIAAGSSDVFQDTGSLSLRPYISYGRNFLRTMQYGSFNFLNTTGYSFATDDERSDHFFTSFHLDFDVGNFHRIYPLVELNWVHYTSDGGVRPLGFEGRDLFNFGTTNIAGQDELTFAAGIRFKIIGESVQMGIAGEWSLIGGGNHLDDFRLTVDMIFRY
jgi:hypothetical protein